MFDNAAYGLIVIICMILLVKNVSNLMKTKGKKEIVEGKITKIVTRGSGRLYVRTATVDYVYRGKEHTATVDAAHGQGLEKEKGDTFLLEVYPDTGEVVVENSTAIIYSLFSAAVIIYFLVRFIMLNF